MSTLKGIRYALIDLVDVTVLERGLTSITQARGNCSQYLNNHNVAVVRYKIDGSVDGEVNGWNELTSKPHLPVLVYQQIINRMNGKPVKSELLTGARIAAAERSAKRNTHEVLIDRKVPPDNWFTRAMATVKGISTK